MAIRTTLIWVSLMLAAAGVAGGRYVYTLWSERDTLLRAKILSTFCEAAPDWQVEIGHARFDFQGRIRLYDLKFQPPGMDHALLHYPEAIVEIDHEQMAEQKLLIHRIQLVQPHLLLIRDTRGKWNLEQIPALPKMSGSPPEWKIEQGIVTIRLENAGQKTMGQENSGQAAPSIFILQGVNLQLIPSGKLQYDIQGVMTSAEVGQVRVEGQLNLASHKWAFNGDLNGVKIGDELVRLVAGVSPEIRENLSATICQLSGSPTSAIAMPESGIDAVADVQFRIAQWEPGSEREFKLNVNVTSGRITNTRLPFNLNELNGRIDCDNRELVIRKMTARNGATEVQFDGKFTKRGWEFPGEFKLLVRDLALDDRLRGRLPSALCEQYDALQLSGYVDLQAQAWYDGQQAWKYKMGLTAKRCSAAHVRFPYPVHEIVGTIACENQSCTFDLEGKAGRRPVFLRGGMRKEGKTLFDIRVNELPIDDTFRTAAKPLPGFLTVMQNLNLRGTANIHFRLERGATGQKFRPRLFAELENCTLACACFPYVLNNLRGIVELVDTKWTFRNLNGVHDSGKVSAEGTYGQGVNPNQLDLRITGEGVDLDKQLRAALPEKSKQKWDDLEPTGRCNVDLRILYSPGTIPEIQFTRLDLYDASFTLRAFPFALHNIKAQLMHQRGRLEILSLEGWHEETKVSLKGSGDFPEEGEWCLTLSDFRVDDLSPDRRFRRALPAAFREVIDNLDPRDGTLCLSGWLQFKGNRGANYYTTAAWDVETVYTGAALTAGVDLMNLHGRVFSRGTWDGERVAMIGQVDLDSLTIQGYQFTQVRGPISIKNKHLVIGSQQAVNVSESDATSLGVTPEHRITAQAIGGQFTLDGIAVLDKSAAYRVLLTIDGAKLDRYAQLYLPSQRKLQGVINGWVELNGRGTPRSQRTPGAEWGSDFGGRGNVRISPAALYELPVMVALFKIFRGVPLDKTAFNEANIRFTVGGRQFSLEQIDLVGDAIDFRGKGYVKFDGKLNLDFYSHIARNRNAIPLLQNLIGEATKGWVGAHIEGTTSDPQATLKALPKLDEALKRFLDSLEPRPLAAPQRLPSRN